MNKNKIIEKLFKEKTINRIIKNISHGLENKNDIQDLEQDIFEILLNKSEELLIDLNNKNELNFYIANIVYTQIRSKTSPYYRLYKKNKNNVQLDDIKEFIQYNGDFFN